MKRPRRRRFILACVTSLTLTGALACPNLAQAGKGDKKANKAGKADKRKAKGQHKIDKLCERIGCSEKQASEIGMVFKQLHLDIKPDREAIRELRKQLASEWKAAKPDERKLTKIADKVAAHERNIADRTMEAMLELHPILERRAA